MNEIIDFTPCTLSSRAGTYGGKAGYKDGIIYKNEYWIIKYPQSTKGMRGNIASYTTSPLSEYIGSHIYAILGYDVHETIMGYRNNKIVVACKDFCKQEGSLREIRTLKNLANPMLAEKLERSFSSTGSSHHVNLEETLLHLKYNDILKNISGVTERFWDCIVIDIFINNNDRNNGNWGILYENNQYKLAPVYDNGASFFNKHTEEQIIKILNNPERMKQSVATSATGYMLHGKPLFVQDMLNLNYTGLHHALIKNVPLIQKKLPEIYRMIDAIPKEYHQLEVCSDCRKEYYKKCLDVRMEQALIPAWKNAKRA